MTSPFLTIREVCEWAKISKTSAHREIRAGNLPARRHAGVLVVRISDLEAWSSGGSLIKTTDEISLFQRARQRVKSGSLKPEVTPAPSRSSKKGET